MRRATAGKRKADGKAHGQRACLLVKTAQYVRARSPCLLLANQQAGKLAPFFGGCKPIRINL